MPRRKPKPEKIVEERIKQSLDSIIMEESLEDVLLPNSDELPRMRSSDMMDISGEKSSAYSDAKELLDAITDFYVDLESNKMTSHVERKRKADAINISSMMFQLKAAQHAITKIIEELDMGNSHPRLYEVLAQLQSQVMQMPKDYQTYLEKMEANYKKTRIEIDEKLQSGRVTMDRYDEDGGYSTSSAITSDGGIKSRGTRGIMEGLREIISSEVVDVKPVVVDVNAVVNAREKKIIDADNPNMVKSDEGGNPDDYYIEDDLLG